MTALKKEFYNLLFNCVVYDIGLSSDFLFPFGADAGDIELQRNDDFAAELELTAFFPYFDRAERNIFVSHAEEEMTSLCYPPAHFRLPLMEFFHFEIHSFPSLLNHSPTESL